MGVGKGCGDPKDKKYVSHGWWSHWEDQGRQAWAFTSPPRVAPNFEAPRAPFNTLNDWGGQGQTGHQMRHFT